MKEQYYKLGFIGAIIFGLMGLSVAFGSYLSQAAENKTQPTTQVMDQSTHVSNLSSLKQIVEEKSQTNTSLTISTVNMPDNLALAIQETLPRFNWLPYSVAYKFTERPRSTKLLENKNYVTALSLKTIIPPNSYSTLADINGDGLVDQIVSWSGNFSYFSESLNIGSSNFTYANINQILMNKGDNSFESKYFCMKLQAHYVRDNTGKELYFVPETYIGDCADTSTN